VYFLSKLVNELQAPVYSIISRRVNRLQLDLDEPFVKSNDPISIAIGSLSVKLYNLGNRIRQTWKLMKRNHLKIYFAVDGETETANIHKNILRILDLHT
jgi:hypothetical protein